MRALRFFNFAFLMLIYVTSCATARLAVENPRELASKQDLRSVVIDVDCEAGGGYGSGVIVSRRAVLTAAHVVACSGSKLKAITIIDYTGDRRAAKISRVSSSRSDGVRLEIEGTSDFDVPKIVSFGKAGRFDQICMSTAKPHRSRVCGTVQEVGPTITRSTMPADFGNSGSGVYNEHDELVGLLIQLVPCNWGGVCGSIINTDLADIF